MPARMAAAVACVLLLGACGGSSGGSSGASGASSSPSGVAACLSNLGYGVTVLPTSDVTSGGAENRGTGQTAELLVGMNGVRPPNTDSNQEAAIIAFFDSPAHAAAEPNAHSGGLLTHADVVGSATVQPWRGLAAYTLKTTSNHSLSALKAAFRKNLKKIESCIS